MNSTFVARYRACLPDAPNGPKFPAIFVKDATEFDYRNASLDDADCGSMQTCVFYLSDKAKRSAERVARDLKVCGVALLYPGDRDLRIYVGAKHSVVQLGETQ